MSDKSTMPSLRVIALNDTPSMSASLPITKSSTTPRRASGISFQTVELFTVSGRMKAQIPKIRKILAILLPTTLPIARSGEPLKAAERLTVSSGADVPKLTIVRPITSGGILSRVARELAPRTRPSAPATSIARPRINSKNDKIITIKYIVIG